MTTYRKAAMADALATADLVAVELEAERMTREREAVEASRRISELEAVTGGAKSFAHLLFGNRPFETQKKMARRMVFEKQNPLAIARQRVRPVSGSRLPLES